MIWLALVRRHRRKPKKRLRDIGDWFVAGEVGWWKEEKGGYERKKRGGEGAEERDVRLLSKEANNY